MKLNNFENMPREDLIIELRAWRGKFNQKVNTEVQKRTEKNAEKLEAILLNYEKNIIEDALKAYKTAVSSLENIIYPARYWYGLFPSLNKLRYNSVDIKNLKEATKIIKSIIKE